MLASPTAKPGAEHRPGLTILPRAEIETDDLRRLGSAGAMSVCFHVVLLGAFALLSPRGNAGQHHAEVESGVVDAQSLDDDKNRDFMTKDYNENASPNDGDFNYPVSRIAEISVPGELRPDELIGPLNGSKDAAPTSLAPPMGLGGKGDGGASQSAMIGNTERVGGAGGELRGTNVPGGFLGRSAATRENKFDSGASVESETAVAKGLAWLAHHQSADGRWKLDGNFPEPGNANDVGGTALGLLPFLGAGKTHKAPKSTKNGPAYDKNIDKALRYLVAVQDKRTGAFSRDMYAHGLATLAISEAFGLSQDYNLKKPAQLALNFIVSAQHAGGGWRYSPGQAGDTSVSGWQIMALKSGLMAGLDVPSTTIKKAQNYLDGCVDATTEGYGYTGPQPTATMTAVSLLCRQYLQAWGPQNIRLVRAVDNFIKPNSPQPTKKDVYFYYYATQVMFHFGGQNWRDWNNAMRDMLVKSQDNTPANLVTHGSWSPQGDAWGRNGGRLMQTSLNLLTLEVYYRYLPLYYRAN